MTNSRLCCCGCTNITCKKKKKQPGSVRKQRFTSVIPSSVVPAVETATCQLPVCCRSSILHRQTAARCRFSLSHLRWERPDDTTRQPERPDGRTTTLNDQFIWPWIGTIAKLYWWKHVPGTPSLSSHWLPSLWIWPLGLVPASGAPSYCGWTIQWMPRGLPVTPSKDTLGSIILIDRYNTKAAAVLVVLALLQNRSLTTLEFPKTWCTGEYLIDRLHFPITTAYFTASLQFSGRKWRRVSHLSFYIDSSITLSAFCLRLKYLNHSWMYLWSPVDEPSWGWWSLDGSSSATMRVKVKLFRNSCKLNEIQYCAN